MSDKDFIPAGFIVPQVYETSDFRLRMLSVDDVDKDYEAVMESADLLHHMYGREWPSATFTREDNLRDLEEHQQEFEQREAFAYTVVSLDESRCLGCVYINPPRVDSAVDARVHMWVRQGVHDEGLDPVLFQAVKSWLDRDWPFASVRFLGREEDGSWFPMDGQQPGEGSCYIPTAFDTRGKGW